MHTIWTAFFYKPLYNALIALVSVIPFGDLGFAVIILTLLVKVILYPFNKKAIEGQVKMQIVQAELAKIKELTPDKQEQAKKTFELYKQHGVSPFSSCLVVLIQFPIILALYYVFFKGINDPTHSLLYTFIHFPQQMNLHFLGFIDMSKPFLVFGVLAGITQYIQLHRSQKATVQPQTTGASMQEQMSASMQKQMKYILPVMIMLVSIKIPSAVALYWITSNIISIIQETRIRRNLTKGA